MVRSAVSGTDALSAHDVPRRATVAALRGINASLDAVFYDLGALTPGERSRLSAFVNPEGSILIVHPRDSGHAIDTFRPWEFVEYCTRQAGGGVDALAVAGVGSSALGTAALARNVADHLGRPVAGIVSGFGMSDLLSEALGGWFVLGARNALRDLIARTFDAFGLKDHVRDQKSHEEMKGQFESVAVDADQFIFGSPDSATLLYVLLKLGLRMKLVVAHSKGSLSVENALQGWLSAARGTGAPVSTDLCIVTLGAVTRFPPEFSNVHQFMGTVDYFGLLNSRPLVPREWMPYDWHSLNSVLPGHMAVQAALRIAGVR